MSLNEPAYGYRNSSLYMCDIKHKARRWGNYEPLACQTEVQLEAIWEYIGSILGVIAKSLQEMTTEAEGKAEYACCIHSIDFGHICIPQVASLCYELYVWEELCLR